MNKIKLSRQQWLRKYINRVLGRHMVFCGCLWASVGHKICSARILASPSIDTKGAPFDRQSFISSTAFSREADWPLFNKTGITSAIGCWLTLNWWHWKDNEKLYLVSNYGLNLAVVRSPSIARNLTRLCSSTLKKLQKTPKSPLSSKSSLNL